MRRRNVLALGASLVAPFAPAQPSPAAAALQGQLAAHPHLRALLVLRGDEQRFEYYRPDTTATTLLPIASVTKSIVSLLAGIAVDKGLLRLDETLPALFPEFAHGPDAGRLSRVTLRHLLTLSPGFDPAPLDMHSDYGDFTARLYAPGLLQHALRRPLKHEPGRRFYYSNIDSHLVLLAVSRRIKEPVQDFARDALFRPLGIDAFDWPANSQGIPDGAGGLRLAAPAMLRIGVMMRDGGAWQGRQVVSKTYVHEATSRQVASDLPPRGSPQLWGYGYLWWTASTPGDDRPAFYAAGYGGQFLYVVPSLGIVIVAVTEQSSREVAAKTAALVREHAIPVAR